MKALLLIIALAAHADGLYGFKVKTLEGASKSLADYRGQTLLIVNTASRCGYTPQYDGLEKLYGKYKAKGFVVLGFPSNDFGGQEPGTNAEIKKFCQSNYKVDFPMFEKGPVKGDGKQPLFAFLTANAPDKGEIKWNFEKFLIDPRGQIVARFDSKVTPDDPKLVSALEKSLAPSNKKGL